MRKTIYKKIKGNTKYWKHESQSRINQFFIELNGPARFGVRFRDRSNKRRCPSGRGCCYCINSRQYSSYKNIERADDMLEETP